MEQHGSRPAGRITKTMTSRRTVRQIAIEVGQLGEHPDSQIGIGVEQLGGQPDLVDAALGWQTIPVVGGWKRVTLYIGVKGQMTSTDPNTIDGMTDERTIIWTAGRRRLDGDGWTETGDLAPLPATLER